MAPHLEAKNAIKRIVALGKLRQSKVLLCLRTLHDTAYLFPVQVPQPALQLLLELQTIDVVAEAARCGGFLGRERLGSYGGVSDQGLERGRAAGQTVAVRRSIVPGRQYVLLHLLNLVPVGLGRDLDDAQVFRVAA